MKIVIADDDELIIEMLSDYLTSAGHEVATASDAPSLIGLVQQEAPGLILMDINMPGIREGGMSQKVKLPAELRGQNIVAITGNEKEKVYQMGLPQDIEVLKKPVDFAELDGIIARLSGGN